MCLSFVPTLGRHVVVVYWGDAGGLYCEEIGFWWLYFACKVMLLKLVFGECEICLGDVQVVTQFVF